MNQHGEEHQPIGQVIEDPESRSKREQFWQRVETSVERLRADPVAWKDYRDEITLLEGGSMDGLEDADLYYTAEEVGEIRRRAH